MTHDVSNTTLGVRKLSLFDRRRFSNASTLSVSTVSTALPQYSTIDSSESPEDEGHWFSESGREGSYASSTFGPQSSLGLPFAIAPPRYSYVNPRHSISLTWTPSTENPGTESLSNGFRYSFPIKANKTWATLHLDTRDPIPGNPAPSASQPKVPRFWGCEPIAGVLELDLDNPHSINEINIMVKGKITTSPLDGDSLLAYEHTLWKRSYGDPHQLDQSGSKEKFNGKLIDKYSFPFSFPFPTQFNLLDKKSDFLSNTNAITPFQDIMHTKQNSTIPSPTSPSQSLHESNGEKRPMSDLPNVYGISPFPYSPMPSPVYASTAAIPESKMKWARTSPSTSASPSEKRHTNAPEKSPVHSSFLRQSESLGVDGSAPSMPQTFFEKGVSASIAYELSIHFVHGRFKPTTKIKANISYVPALQPRPTSQKRKEAYETGAHVPGPFSDPDGWFPMPTSTIHGTFNCDGRQRQTRIDCTLYVASPLSYTRGTVIPCFLVLSSYDVEALIEMLCTPNIPSVGLMRRLRHFVPADEDQREQNVNNAIWTDAGLGTRGSPGTIIVPSTVGDGKDHIRTMLHEMGKAAWWESGVRNEPNTRHLQGEIHLSADLEPSCACKIFTVEYYVEMLSLRSACFEPNSDRPVSPRTRNGSRRRSSIATVPVEITTLCRPDEPIPIPFSRPPRVHVRRVSLGDAIPEDDESQ